MNLHQSPHEDELECHGPSSFLDPLTVAYPLRKLSIPIRLNGETLDQWRPAKVVEWVDSRTGEILSDTDYRKLFGKPVYRSERALQRDYVLRRLRPEARSLARYILGFRNLRRGVSPAIPILVKWYAGLTGQRVANIRRIVPTLAAAGIVESDTLVGALWQHSGNAAPSASFLQEESRSAVAHAVQRMERRASRSLQGRNSDWEQRARPSWLNAAMTNRQEEN